MGIFCRPKNPQILKLATYSKLKINILSANLQLFSGKDCHIFIFYFVYTKHQVFLICDENNEINVSNLMMQYRLISSWE